MFKTNTLHSKLARTALFLLTATGLAAPAMAANCTDDFRKIINMETLGHTGGPSGQFDVVLEGGVYMRYKSAHPNIPAAHFERIYALALTAYAAGIKVRGAANIGATDICGNVDYLVTEPSV